MIAAIVLYSALFALMLLGLRKRNEVVPAPAEMPEPFGETEEARALWQAHNCLRAMTKEQANA